MGRQAAQRLHLALVLTGLVLYAVFILPRWWVLTGDIPATLGTAGRIAAGIPIALAAWPVAQILQAAIRAKSKTPELALRLRAWSTVLHVVAGALILLTAIAEFWLTPQTGGPWLFGVYGAAGAIAVLAVLALYLSYVAEKPPAEPKPAKPAKPVKAKKAKTPKKPRTKRGRKSATTDGSEAAADEVEVDEVEVEAQEADPETAADAKTEEATPEASESDTDTDTGSEPEDQPSADSAGDDAGSEDSSALRNKRPTGKRRHRLRR